MKKKEVGGAVAFEGVKATKTHERDESMKANRSIDPSSSPTEDGSEEGEGSRNSRRSCSGHSLSVEDSTGQSQN